MSDHHAMDDDMSTDGPVPRGMSALKRVLGRVFTSCQSDPKGSVHRAWGISLIFVVLYFIVAIIESKYCFALCATWHVQQALKFDLLF